MPGKDVGGEIRAGSVNVIYGSAAGLDPSGTSATRCGTSTALSCPGTAAAGDLLGRTVGRRLQRRPLRRPGRVGAPARAGTVAAAGAALVLYGSAAGLLPGGPSCGTRAPPPCRASSVPGIRSRGRSRPAIRRRRGRRPGDRQPLRRPPRRPRRGHGQVLYGSVTGLTSTASQLLSQNTAGVPGSAENTDIFGWDVAAGVFDGSSRDGLAVGVPPSRCPGWERWAWSTSCPGRHQD